jgi:hypothetical protein
VELFAGFGMILRKNGHLIHVKSGWKKWKMKCGQNGPKRTKRIEKE